MQLRVVRLALLVLLCPSAGSASAKGLCAAIRTFEETALSRNEAGEEMPRTVELFWRGPWGIDNIGYRCQHHGDPAGKALCLALVDHMPQEFRTNLLFRILRCYGYRFPALTTWSNWQSQIDLVEGGKHRLRLDVNMYLDDGSRDALRLASLPRGYDRFDPDETPLPPLKMPVPKPDEDKRE